MTSERASLGRIAALDYWVARACDEYDTLRSAGLFHVEAREAVVQQIELLAGEREVPGRRANDH
jgi:hypothetical protein